MNHVTIRSVSEQIADYIKLEIQSGRWAEFFPGRNELAKQFDQAVMSVEMALQQLEKEGWLISQGAGRPRKVFNLAESNGAHSLRIAILIYEREAYSDGIYPRLLHLLREDGHDAFFVNTTQMELGGSIRKLSRIVDKIKADAWILCTSTREFAAWFAQSGIPVFALFGRRRGLPIASAGPDKSTAIAEATKKLISLGHERIVMLVREDRRQPHPGYVERAFLRELERNGLLSSKYHLPDWKDGSEGLLGVLQKIFATTPPTALIVDELAILLATQQFLASKTILVPRDVSLVSMEYENVFAWSSPMIAHVKWDIEFVLKRTRQWARNVAKGKKDFKETNTLAVFVEGGTIAIAKR